MEIFMGNGDGDNRCRIFYSLLAQKKTGPLRARFRFAEVGASTIHLPEGNTADIDDCQSGRMRQPLVVQHVCSMRVAMRPRNAKGHMPAMRTSQRVRARIIAA